MLLSVDKTDKITTIRRKIRKIIIIIMCWMHTYWKPNMLSYHIIQLEFSCTVLPSCTVYTYIFLYFSLNDLLFMYLTKHQHQITCLTPCSIAILCIQHYRHRVKAGRDRPGRTGVIDDTDGERPVMRLLLLKRAANISPETPVTACDSVLWSCLLAGQNYIRSDC